MSETTREYPEVVEYMSNVDCFNSYNNIKLTVLRDDYAEGQVMLSQNSMNPNGKVHGGLLFAAADYVGGFVAGKNGRNCVTQSGNISFLRPADGQFLIVKALPVKVGQKLAVVDVCIYDDEDKLVAKCTNTYFFVG